MLESINNLTSSEIPIRAEYNFEINNPLLVESNIISTSKYTWYNLIPKLLYEQFTKLANLYFLIIGLMQVILLILDN